MTAATTSSTRRFLRDDLTPPEQAENRLHAQKGLLAWIPGVGQENDPR